MNLVDGAESMSLGLGAARGGGGGPEDAEGAGLHSLERCIGTAADSEFSAHISFNLVPLTPLFLHVKVCTPYQKG